MATTIKVGPLSRIEGHLDIEVSVEAVGGEQKVVDAHSSGTMFRGFEIILGGRDPRDAPHLTQRICGVCPIAHGMASSKTLESAFGAMPTNNGRILRNLVLGSNFVQSHILHFYHLAALDYVNTTGVLDIPPWTPRFLADDMLAGDEAAAIAGHYVQAIAMRRKSHQMGAIFGGKLPCSPTFIPGGCSETVTQKGITDFGTLLSEISSFVTNVYLPDVEFLAQRFPEYSRLGRGYGNLLAYGVFDLDAAGMKQHLRGGTYTAGRFRTLDPKRIAEHVQYSRYSASTGTLHPSQGATVPHIDKPGAYSWLKAPRYMDKPHEVGPLARMAVAGKYRKGISAMDRLMARAVETAEVCSAMSGWLNQLQPGQPSHTYTNVPLSGTGSGLTEAPRGALGHWIQIAGSAIDRYQIVTPTAWNASPRDDRNQRGPIEQALVGTPVADPNNPVELLRVVHSFDPCMACSVHMARPGKKAKVVSVNV